VRISRALLDELVAHARDEAPNECCGWIGARDGAATTVYRARNKFASPLRYEIAEEDTLRIFDAIDAAGEEIGATYHSHTRSAPVPSQTDVNQANPLLGSALYLIVGVADSEPDVRAYAIERASGFTPAELTVE
jgi:[CysO sulfur-carrier protein]-S-L-cysteine hydrolase